MQASVPDTSSLARLTDAAAGCTACELYEDATQTVFGAGPRRARIVLVGEQPGDIEDREGQPFVGPAGHVLDRALDAAGIAREDAFVTNAVKHFRWKPAPRGKRRIHQRPGATHISACGPWLAAELRAVRPEVVVALGAVAGQALFGRSFSVTRSRGVPLRWPPEDGPFVASRLHIDSAFVTLHPSAILRGGDEQRDELFRGLVADLEAVQRHLADTSPTPRPRQKSEQ